MCEIFADFWDTQKSFAPHLDPPPFPLPPSPLALSFYGIERVILIVQVQYII